MMVRSQRLPWKPSLFSMEKVRASLKKKKKVIRKKLLPSLSSLGYMAQMLSLSCKAEKPVNLISYPNFTVPLGPQAFSLILLHPPLFPGIQQ